MRSPSISLVTIYLTSFGFLLVHAVGDNDVQKTNYTSSNYLGMNKVQTFLIRQFRIQNIQYLTDDYLRSDNHIIGLLRACQWKISTASKLLQKILRWRLVNNMDALGETEPDVDMLNIFPYRLNTLTTRDGCPVLEVAAGRWQFADFLESTEFVRDALKMFKVHEAQMIEKLRYSVKKAAPRCDQGVIIVNLTDFKIRNIAEPNALSLAMTCGTDAEIYYGNLFKSIIFIHTPPEFMNVVNILKTYAGQTGKVMSVYSDEEMDAAFEKIYSYIDPLSMSSEMYRP